MRQSPGLSAQWSCPVEIFARLTTLVALTALGCLVGCSGKGKVKTKVSGSVTINGKPVAGTVVFLGSDKKEYSSPLDGEGNYSISNIPEGDYKVLVRAPKGPAGGFGLSQPTIPKDATKDMAAKEMPKIQRGGGGLPPPAKYASPENGLHYTVEKGEQTFPIPLKP